MSTEATASFVLQFVDIAERDSILAEADERPLDQISDVRRAVAEERELDEKLMSRVCEGDRQALSLLFQKHASAVLSVVRRIIRDEGEAEDLLQDVFLFVAQRAHLFDSTKCSAISWIIQVAYHRAFDRRRYLNKRSHYDAQEFQDDLHGTHSAEMTVDGIECRELLRKFQDELTAEQRQTLELHFFQGYTFLEIAGKTGQTLGNVRHHHYRGLERLRALVFRGKRD